MPDSEDSHTNYTCSFCSKGQSEVRRLIAGQGLTFICDGCIQLCQQLIDEEQAASEKPVFIERIPTPKDLFEKLSEYVVGQDRAKKVLSVAVYNHYKRINSKDDSDVELDKTNILLVGPTGCGKTLLAQTLAKILDVPFAISDATTLTEAGYVGEDVENILLRLIQTAEYDIAKAERGIIYIDEIDKIARKSPNPSITRDVTGEGVQQALLKVVEGCVANVPPQGGRKHPHQEYLQINTKNILFICGGTFNGLEDIIEQRVNKDVKSIGFTAQYGVQRVPKEFDMLIGQVIPEDLLGYGLIPEFVGRLPIVVGVNSLDKEALMRILTEPKNAIVRQYERIFELENIELVFKQEALEKSAAMALRHKTGARGLRSIIEEALMDVMYEVPSMDDVAKCVVDADVISRKRPPLLLTAEGKHISYDLGEAKTA